MSLHQHNPQPALFCFSYVPVSYGHVDSLQRMFTIREAAHDMHVDA